MTNSRLLILDDDPLTGQTIRNIAALAGFDVELTDSHREFFSALENVRPDAIALDLVMPEMDGVEVIAELAKRHCTSKIIITSGVGGRILDAASRSAAERGLDIIGVLPKPFTPTSLRQLLARCPSSEPLSADVTDAWTAHGDVHGTLTPQDLEQAIQSQQIRVYYQPKISCQGGQLSGFEALARWTHPVHGVVPPDEFIPLAESNGLIDALTLRVMEEALVWLRDFRAGIRAFDVTKTSLPDPSQLTMSINISALSLGNVAIFDRMNVMCREMEIQPQSLILELTETSAMDDPVSSLEMLTRLRLRGFRLSIDDFGTGYSSMLQLVKLPFSEIKVDKSFVTTARSSEESRVVIKSIVGLAMNLGLIVTAEGIEDEDTMSFLRSIDCTLAQGYHIGHPMPGELVMSWLTSRAGHDESRRLAALHSLGILDSPREERFDLPVKLAIRLLQVPMAGFALVDSEEVWFKASSGLLYPMVLRADSFCAHTIDLGRMHIIGDLSKNPLYANHTFVASAPQLRFYAGCPVNANDGSTIGTMLVLDTVARTFNDEQIATLQDLAGMIEHELYVKSRDEIDEVTSLLDSRGMEERVTTTLNLCRRLQHNCSLHVVELPHMLNGTGSEVTRRNNHLLATTARLLGECFNENDIVGRFERDKFIVFELNPDEKQSRMAKWKFDSAVRAHNHNATPQLEIVYRIGTAHSGPEHDYQLQSLLGKADRAMLQSLAS